MLEMRAIEKQFNRNPVLKKTHFSLRKGEVHALMGGNGAGKSTLMKILTGVYMADAGEILIDGKPVVIDSPKTSEALGIAMIFQEFSLVPSLTVAQNIQAVLELQGYTDSDIQERLDVLLEDLHITHIRNNPAISLSGGERRRVEIARALATEPRFILLDEPFAGVDPIAVLDIQKIIRFLKERGIGVLITDHNVRETLGICDRAYIINAGSVMAEGKPDEIIYNEGVRKVYLGEHFKL